LLLLKDIPHLAARLSLTLFIRNFTPSIEAVQKPLDIINAAASELRKSTDFKFLLQTILAVGNVLNEGTSRGGAQVRGH
jgi:formin 2